MIQLMKFRKIYYTFSGLLALARVLALVFWGLNLGIYFKIGSFLFCKFYQKFILLHEKIFWLTNQKIMIQSSNLFHITKSVVRERLEIGERVGDKTEKSFFGHVTE